MFKIYIKFYLPRHVWNKNPMPHPSRRFFRLFCSSPDKSNLLEEFCAESSSLGTSLL